MLYSQPGLGWVLERVVRPIISMQMIDGAALVAAAWPTVEGALRSIPGVDEHWGQLTRGLARLWWRRGKGFEGRTPAPYDPQK